MIRRSLLTLVLAAGLSAAAHAQSAAPTLTAERRAYVAARIYAAIQMQFAHWEGVPDLDLDAEFQKYLSQAMVSDGRLEFDLATLEFVAKLRNGHSWLNDRWLWREHGQPLGFAASYMDGQWVVIRSQVEGLRPGAVIEAVDGVAVEDFFQQKRKYITGSDERAVRKNLFFRTFLLPQQFTLTADGGKQFRIDRKNPLPPAPEPQTEGRWLEAGRVAYIKIPSFNDPRLQKRALELVEEYKDAAALIVDVRGNGGGSTPGDLTEALMDRPYRWWAESTPLHIGLLRYYAETGNARYPVLQRAHLSWPPEVVKPEKTLFRGKLLLLADGRCASACEDFLVPFKDNGRGVLLGERTEGSSGQPYTANLGDDVILGIGTKREYFPGGGQFEGVGIAPDVEVKLRADDLKAGRDPVLARALELARTGKP